MTLPSSARTLALCLLVGTLAGLSGCKSDGTSAGGGSDSDISGPPTFNAMYQSRNPRVCAKVTSKPSPAQAAALVQCSTESDTTGGSLPMITLVTDLQVEMGSARPFLPGTDSLQNIDVTAKVYPLRGQGTMWQCLTASSYPPGQNCMKYPAVPKGQGECWKTTFGDWQCVMTTGSQNQLRNQKGPTTY